MTRDLAISSLVSFGGTDKLLISLSKAAAARCLRLQPQDTAGSGAWGRKHTDLPNVSCQGSEQTRTMAISVPDRL
jgi:hypothetical protein